MMTTARLKPASKTARPTIVLTTPQLRTLCDQAEKLKFSNGPNEHFWQTVDPNGVHVVGIWFVHRPRMYLWQGVDHPWDFTHGGGKNIRAEVMCKMLGRTEPCHLKCDFDHDAFLKHVNHACRNRRKARRNRRRKPA
jgi:hypothetical protein